MSGCRTRLLWRTRKQCLNHSVPDAVADLLYDSASLTARLIRKCAGRFHVEVLSERRITVTPDEMRALRLPFRRRALVREVLLRCDRQAWVYARTVIPLHSLQGPLRRLTRLGNRPLGAVLFADPGMRREEMEVTRVSPDHACYSGLRHGGEEVVWGRRSVFRINRRPLLVSEFFLPAIYE